MAMAVPRSAEARENALHAAYARLQTGVVAASVDEDIEQWLAQKQTAYSRSGSSALSVVELGIEPKSRST